MTSTITPEEQLTITQWMVTGRVGNSSKFLAAVTLGLETEDRSWTWPLDPDDLTRCQRLVELCPAVHRVGFPRAAASHPVWAALVDHWDELLEMLDAEAPGWRDDAPWRCPKTYARMKELGA